MFNDLTAHCLVIPERLEYYNSYIQPKCTELGINVKRFLVGEEIRDGNQLPPRLDYSTDYPTWFSSPRPLNALRAHQMMLRYAMAENLNEVLFLEDDIVFGENMGEGIYEEWQPELFKSYDMIYFGSYNANKLTNTYISPHLIKLNKNGCGGFHGVLIKKTLFERLSNLICYGPLDWMCQQSIHPIYNCYAVSPSLINQKSGFSYIENCDLEKNNG